MGRVWEKALFSHIEQWIDYQLGNQNKRLPTMVPQETETLYRSRCSLHERKGSLLKVKASVEPYRLQRMGEQEHITYQTVLMKLYKVNGKYHLEERVLHRTAKTHDGHLIIDQPNTEQFSMDARCPIGNYEKTDRAFHYDRHAAVQYAERWWNDYNPAYRKFKDNCTNFISQCLRAGNAPMRGMPDRGKGWWHQKQSWSYSWAVAHSFRWYLSGSTSGLTAVEAEDAKELGLGDVICYDFNGDGNWQHSTIVTAFDGNNEPLVNAQTENSRGRYWKYEDSTAWTPNIRYKFFRIT
ncbi:Putative amidase domain-containing protein [Alteribacillus persepolensis]|uniref:Putative amidase domain-containing protein n=1 Tax=Alteribacillus persepolensis TaxID=568899 RepID=A0A1G8D8S0_9BACI|nr:amidase domain-containing protein [Alteribacillus persepolensis]SDH54146.1 Putative amidase domain-containing protein [Alteribacillus persepolensis]